ncbi:MAG: Rpn family recombination-promoting nuclease/putative transposase [Lachnospiraceae bacterium]|nr:Rpn family recombination-promoting nuclease/putative transposase [Lachnospiraceae bacterium]
MHYNRLTVRVPPKREKKEQKGIRLDVFCEDAEHTRYNVEMQVVNRKIFKRARYYHGQIDMEMLLAGMEYEELPDSYVIFVCDFDPFGAGKYQYTSRTVLQEVPQVTYEDGVHTIFLSTKGTNDAEVSAELAAFMKYVGASLEESEADYQSALVEQFQKSIHKIKADREMRSRFMLFEEMMKDEFKAGKAEGKAEHIVDVVLSNKAKGRSVAEIAEFLNKDIDTILTIYDSGEKAGMYRTDNILLHTGAEVFTIEKGRYVKPNSVAVVAMEKVLKDELNDKKYSI